MFAKEYTSEYPEITMDKDKNSVNDNMIRQMTIEEWYDLLHHTHKVNEFVDEQGNKVKALYAPINEDGSTDDSGLTLDEQTINAVNEMKLTVAELKKTVEAQQKTIESQQKVIESLSKASSQHIDVVDWDASTPELDPAPVK